MTTTRKLTSIATAAALAVASLVPMTTPASAGGGWNGGHYHKSYNGYSKRHYHGDHRHYGYRRYKRDKTGKYIALGVGALVLGIIAANAR